MAAPLSPAILACEVQFGTPVLLYVAVPTRGKALAEDDVAAIYEAVRTLPKNSAVTLVLNTTGGSVAACARIAHLIREHFLRLRIVVPWQARSAGTLLALAADEIVLGPYAELSPIDANLESAGPAEGGVLPQKISTNEIRAFGEMARAWLGLDLDTRGADLLHLLGQRFFPTSLSSLYLAEEYARQIAEELLTYHLPESSVTKRRSIVRALTMEYRVHAHTFSLKALKKFGLNVRRATAAEFGDLTSLLAIVASKSEITNTETDVIRRCTAVIASRYTEGSYLEVVAHKLPPTPSFQHAPSRWEFTAAAKELQQSQGMGSVFHKAPIPPRKRTPKEMPKPVPVVKTRQKRLFGSAGP